MKNNILKSILGFALGAVFLYFTLNNKPLDEIFASLKNATIGWILLSVLGLIMTFFLRAFRWKVLLESSDARPVHYSVIYSLILGYFVNSFTPKFGEIIRCTSLKKTERIPTSLSFGTVVSERIYDVLVLLLGLLVIFFIEIDRLGSIMYSFFYGLFQLFRENAWIAVIAFVLTVLGIIVLYWLSKRNKLAAKIKSFFNQVLVSLKMSLKMRKYKSFILYTILIWLVLTMVNYTFLLSLPGTQTSGFYFAFIVLFVGSVGWAVPSPSGIGTSNFMILQLFVAFGLNADTGVSLGLLISGITFAVTVGLGSLALIYHILKKKKIAKDIAE